eukprot:8495656-Pyramimonas_sp.AAC.1
METDRWPSGKGAGSRGSHHQYSSATLGTFKSGGGHLQSVLHTWHTWHGLHSRIRALVQIDAFPRAHSAVARVGCSYFRSFRRILWNWKVSIPFSAPPP